MCKTCAKRPFYKDELEWENFGFGSQRIAENPNPKCAWAKRSSGVPPSEEGSTDEEPAKASERRPKRRRVRRKGQNKGKSAVTKEDSFSVSQLCQVPTEDVKHVITSEGNPSEVKKRSPFQTSSRNARASSSDFLTSFKAEGLISSSGAQVFQEGKLEAKRHHHPVTRGRRPFFYLPTDEPSSGDPTDHSAEDNYDPPSLDISDALASSSDIYQVPKSLPSSAPLSEQCSPDGGPRSLQEGNPPQRDFPLTPTSIKSDFGEEGIKSKIRRCLARVRSRSISTSTFGSVETGLYRLESIVKEAEEATEDVRLPISSPRTPKPHVQDAGTITDVCASENIPEVEIISLVQEQIPCYKLKADVISEFSGFDNEGWTVQFPALKESEVEALSPEQAEGALAYFVLCGNRVSQMTRTYHDIEAVTRLLQEKEKDLELAARIGQQLLARNKGLQEKNSSLEAELCSSSERITQLKHDLLMKTDLLQIYTNDFDDSSAENTPTSLRHINVDLLQRRVKTLENENVYLREEASQLADDTDYCEEKEKELVNDVIKQLNEANLQVNQLSDELSRKIEDNLRQQEELTQLLAQVVDLQATNKRRTRENEELGSLIGVARECQQELSTELAELKEKYAEVLDLLHDTQEQLRRVQKKSFPGSRVSHLGGGGMFSSLHFGSDSIASELHSLSSAEDQTEKTDGAKCLSRVFDTVRLSSKLGNSLPPAGYTGSPVYSTPTKQASQVASHFSTPLHMTGSYSSYFGSGVSIGGSSGLHSLDSGAESDGSFPTDSEDNYPASRPGVPGWPGTPDLDSCLRRLGPQDRNSLSYLPYGCRTPDSIMSTGSAKSGMSSYSSQNWKLPQKLQIVKPIEGSLTLHHWSRLATPHLGGLLEDKEGIAVKGATNSGLNLELYSMSDLEEEEEEEENEENKCFPGKQFMSTSGVFTYTNSTVLHPDDVTNLTSSLRQTQMSALPSAPVYDSLPSTPSHSASSQPPSRRGSTATFSTSIGIAKHLRERGFTDEPQSSALPLTATPANSPEGTRAGTPEPYTYKLPCFEDLTRHFHAGASFIRRHFYGDITPSNASSPGEGPKVNLVERIHALGVERLVGSTEFTQSVGGVVMTRPQPVSPLLHLSNLIRSNAKNTSGVTTTGDSSSSTQGSIMSTPRITSPGERRPQIPTGAPMGIPGHPGAGHLDSRLTQLKPGQRLDLGTVGSVGSRPRPAALGSVPLGRKDEKMGTIGWTSLGRKGGLS